MQVCQTLELFAPIVQSLYAKNGIFTPVLVLQLMNWDIGNAHNVLGHT